MAILLHHENLLEVSGFFYEGEIMLTLKWNFVRRDLIMSSKQLPFFVKTNVIFFTFSKRINKTSLMYINFSFTLTPFEQFSKVAHFSELFLRMMRFQKNLLQTCLLIFSECFFVLFWEKKESLAQRQLCSMGLLGRDVKDVVVT